MGCHSRNTVVRRPPEFLTRSAPLEAEPSQSGRGKLAAELIVWVMKKRHGEQDLPKLTSKVPVVGTRPEVALLLCCARTWMDTQRAERINGLLAEEINWKFLIHTASQHGVLPLLYSSLKDICPEAVPKAVLNQLRNHFYTNAARNVFLADELLKLLTLFETHGIRAIPYKGPALAASAYGNLLLRQFGDLDILVPKRDVLRAKDLLISHGYRLKFQLTRSKEAAYLQSQCDYNFVRDDGKIIIELHWGITRSHFSFPLDLEHLWEDLEAVSLSGTTIRHLSPENLLLVLCVHGAKHGWSQLKWICDIVELTRRYQDLDWKRIIEQAVTLRSVRMLLLGLCLARNLLGATLPEKVVQQIQATSKVQSLAAQVNEQLFREADDLRGLWQRHLFPGKALERLQDRLRYSFHIIKRLMSPNTKDRALVPLPASLVFLYYFLRPIRLMGQYRVRPSKHLRD
jgi:hypothetical protein